MGTGIEEDDRWKKVFRSSIPPGVQLLDEENLDYSVASVYTGPPLTHDPPIIEPLGTDDLNYHVSPSLIEKGTSSLEIVQSLHPNGSLESKVDDHEDECIDAVTVLSSNDGSDIVSGKPTFVKFQTAEDRKVEGFPSFSSPSIDASQNSRKEGKKGTCGRCNKKNMLMDRESCFVCDAKYCNNCVFKAMGSMPEGRKCVSCIGRPIDESKRSNLGKCSRMLSKLCSPLEVMQIMKAEKECLTNQIQPEQLIVNGKSLTQEELGDLLGCPVPPENLRPGRYWYDKDSGLWGKEGEKPERIITAKLKIGGKLQMDASNGNTEVYINGREITKMELRVLKFANVQCPRDTHFWVYEDGSYEEEGQNNIKGKIWEKVSTRLFCSLFSLPMPHEKIPGSKEDVASCSSRSVPEYLDQRRLQKLLLLGLEGSGTSTIYKQAKFLYANFTPGELEELKFMIQSNMYKYLGTLLENRERFEEEALERQSTPFPFEEMNPGKVNDEANKEGIYSINQKLKTFSDWVLDIMAMGDLETFFLVATSEYAPWVDEVWRDPSIQETYKRKNELHSLPDVAKYFLDRAIEISSNEYEPSEKDILYAEGVPRTNGVAFIDFSLDDRSPMSDGYSDNFSHSLSSGKDKPILDFKPPRVLAPRYQLIRINSKGLKEGCKWLQMFEDMQAVIFCVSLSDYDQKYAQESGRFCNKMIAEKQFFERIIRHPIFEETPFILILNKFDVFEEKISKVPLTVCDWFENFQPVKGSRNISSLPNQAYYYIAMKFKNLYTSITGQKLFVWKMNARERNTVNEAFNYVREVLRWHYESEDANWETGGESPSFSTKDFTSSQM